MNYRLITVLPLATSADRFLPVPNKSYALLLHIEYGSACFKDRLSLKNDFLPHKKIYLHFRYSDAVFWPVHVHVRHFEMMNSKLNLKTRKHGRRQTCTTVCQR